MSERVKITRILFVCLGNIVRSPLAKALFSKYVSQSGLDGRFVADSAGTSWAHVGETPDERMVRVSARHGLSYSHQSRQVKPQDLDDFDLVITMDRQNFTDIQLMAQRADQQSKVHMLREWDPLGGALASVPDPYYGGKEGFEEVYSVIDRSVQQLVKSLSDENS